MYIWSQKVTGLIGMTKLSDRDDTRLKYKIVTQNNYKL